MRCYVGVRYGHRRRAAQKLMHYFASNFKNLYGRRSVSHNVHALIHVHDDAAHYRCLERVSCFKFENKLQRLKKLVRKSDRPLKQIVRRGAEIGLSVSSHVANHVKVLRDVEDLQLGLQAPFYSSILVKNFKVAVRRPDNCFLLEDGSLVLVSKIGTVGNVTYIHGHILDDLLDYYSEPRKSSDIDNFFCLGSPLSVFLALRWKDPRDVNCHSEIIPPTLCRRLFNIYHPSDPVAYRLGVS
ncbi:hypothetical protein J437_LFUL014352 [Ladona fulva]|uniref:DDHD domain-containing protein n=1 Tax=Ladona fulva TaxID=123851 RepID=A0A8K0KSA2_LADFU|nr:hypothetical protein J437_LFUL014352 [Ladona fulva]